MTIKTKEELESLDISYRGGIFVQDRIFSVLDGGLDITYMGASFNSYPTIQHSPSMVKMVCIRRESTATSAVTILIKSITIKITEIILFIRRRISL